jgi:hypothetical protein
MRKIWAQSAFVLLSGCTLAMLVTVARPTAASASGTRKHHPAAGDYCDESTPCGAGLYCATDTTSPACGAGVCATSPQVCPSLWSVGECGCDGNWYLNALCAQSHGAAPLGPRAIAGAAVSDIVGTWTRVVSQNLQTRVEVDEALTVAADGTYSLADTERCIPEAGKLCWHSVKIDAKAIGTIAAGANGGFLMQATCAAGDCSTLATEVTLVHDCGNYEGALQLSITPPGDSPESTDYYLVRQ